MAEPINAHFLQSQNELLFRQVLLHRSSAEFLKMVKFISRRSKFSPFNRYLLYVQNPEVTVAATISDWAKEGRTIKPNARILITLANFGPHQFVVDIGDTEGPELFDSIGVDYWQSKGTCDPEAINEIIEGMSKVGIQIDKQAVQRPLPNQQKEEPVGKALCYPDGKRSVQLRCGARTESYLPFFGTLVHEYAHHLLGHLGEWEVKDRRARPQLVCRDRSHLGLKAQEWEAELTAYIVCNNLGLTMGSDIYLTQFLERSGEPPAINFEKVLTAANWVIDAHAKAASLFDPPAKSLQLTLTQNTKE